MSEKKITLSPEQRDAAKFDGNTIVSAGAGCGKTATMIERVIRKIREGITLDEMLIVTFTRAAAADIRLKLSERLNALLVETPADRLLTDALYSMPVADIGTLHSYCQKLIRNYFFVAGIDPAATVMDDAEAKVMMGECIRAAVDDALRGGDKYFCDACDLLEAGRKGVCEKIRSVASFARSLPDPKAYLEKTEEDEASYSKLDSFVGEKERSVRRDLEALKARAVAHGNKKIIDCVNQLFELIDGKDIINLYDKPTVKNDPAATAILDDFTVIRENCKSFRELLDSAIKAKKVDSSKYAAAICNVTADALDRYAKRKKELGKMDYSDLEHGARRILSDADRAAEITSKKRCVFIDEYQDVNPLQAEIAEKFKAGGAVMFLVGDIKQSIYAFRRCDPKFFAAALADNDYKRFDLTGNYRSSPEVIDFVNAVFSANMTENLGGVDYADGKNALRCNSTVGGAAEFIEIDGECEPPPPEEARVEDTKSSGVEDTKSVDTKNPSECEAQPPEPAAAENADIYSVMKARTAETTDPEAAYVAGRILELVDPRGKEKAAFGSIAVLTRSTKTAFCRSLVDILSKCGVPVSINREDELKFFPEAKALVDIARCVDNGCDDVALYTALRSPMGGFSDCELEEISRGGRAALIARTVDISGAAFWQKAAVYRGRLSARLDAFFETRNRLALYAACHDAESALGYITSEIDYFRHVYAAASNGHSAASIEALIAFAAGKQNLHAFIDLCDAPDFKLAADDGGDAVTLNTIHGAKGLEYDYVFVSDCANKFRFDDASERIIVRSEGVALKFPDDETGEAVPSAPYILAREAIYPSVRSEEMRLLYVALTRAKKMLVVTCKKEKRSDPAEANNAADFIPLPPKHIDSVVMPAFITYEAAEDRSKAEKITNAVKARCEFVYPYSTSNPIKTCVTAVAADAEDVSSAPTVLTDDERIGAAPREGEADGTARKVEACVDPRVRGTAYHRAMELIDFDAPSFDAIAAECENAELVDGAVIERAAADMRELTRGAAFVAKERYFVVDLPAEEVGLTGDGALVQGIIDLLVVDKDGNATIIDYKTTAPDKLESEAYRTQLRLYAAAVERCTPFTVVRALLYSFERGFIELHVLDR